MASKKGDGDFISEKVNYMAQAICNKLPENGMKEFAKLTTDTERFAFVWNLSDTHEVIVLEPEYEMKSVEKGKLHREKGNEYFQRKSYLSALGEYNISVKYAPNGGVTNSSTAQNSITEKPASQNGVDDQKSNGKENAGQEEGNVSVDKTDIETAKSSDKIPATGEDAKNELALAYANRSAALLHLKRYKDCLRDIDLTFESGYSQNMHHKLHERRGCCLKEIAKTDDAIKSFNKALDNLPHSDLSSKGQATKREAIQKLISDCKKITIQSTVVDANDQAIHVSKVTGENSKTFPNASYAVKLQYNNVLGRHAVASRDVKVGDVLISECPHTAVMFDESYIATHCYHCFAHVTAPVPCVQCAGVSFCSQECRNAAWQRYHQAECLYAELLKPSICAKIGHLAMRLAMSDDLDSMLNYLKTNASESGDLENAGKDADGVYIGDYNSVYNLTTNAKYRKPDDVFDFAVAACVLVKIMMISGYLKSIADSQADVELIGGAVLRHLQIVQCNASRIIELSYPEKFDDPKPVTVGAAIYPTVALVNHSCDPNADLNFFGNCVIVRAIRNIMEGEEICISYGPVFYEVKQKIRHTQLKGAYYFSCRCEACRENWPVAEEMFDEMPRYRCEKCRNPLVAEEKFERKYIICAFCKHKQDMEELVGQLQLSFDVYARAMNAAMNGRSDSALPDFVQHLLLLQSHIRHPWRDLAACQSAIKQCYRLGANVKRR